MQVSCSDYEFFSLEEVETGTRKKTKFGLDDYQAFGGVNTDTNVKQVMAFYESMLLSSA